MNTAITIVDAIRELLAVEEGQTAAGALHRAIVAAATAIGELQMATAVQRDEIKVLRAQCSDLVWENTRMRGELLRASGHRCDPRPRCMKCGVLHGRTTARVGHVFREMQGWVGTLCEPCERAIEAEFDGDPKLKRAAGEPV